GLPKTTPLPLTAAQQDTVQKLHDATQDATLGDQGLALAGGGRFDVSARNVNLGISGGISVAPPDALLARLSLFGANLNIHVAGDIDMTSTKIANESLSGGIDLNVGGRLDIGGQFTTFGDPAAPKGIFTTSGGNVSVVANKDVNVNGSRIAAYNGGNIYVKS